MGRELDLYRDLLVNELERGTIFRTGSTRYKVSE